jgi:hypothetical protein
MLQQLILIYAALVMTLWFVGGIGLNNKYLMCIC